MKKPVPDPPAFDLSQATTSHTSFGIPDFNGNPLFSIREGICAEDALVHTCLLLNCVRASAYDAAQHLSANDQSLILGIAQHAEMARALVDAVLEGVNRSGSGRRG